MSFEINKDFEKDLEKEMEKIIKKDFKKKTGGKVTKMTKTSDGYDCQISFDTIEKIDKYINKYGVDGVDWDTVKEMEDKTEEFVKKYKDYLK